MANLSLTGQATISTQVQQRIKNFLPAWLIILYLFFGSAPVIADDLVCDPQENATAYDIEINDNYEIAEWPAEDDGALRFDLDPLPKGKYKFRVRAYRDPYFDPSDWTEPLNARKSPQGEWTVLDMPHIKIRIEISED